MGKKPNITDEQLKKELEKGKTHRQIAEEHGYNTPWSRRLNTRINQLGYKSNNSFSIRSQGTDLHIDRETIEKAVKINSDVDKDSDKYFFRTSVTSDGNLEIIFTDKQYRKTREVEKEE